MTYHTKPLICATRTEAGYCREVATHESRCLAHFTAEDTRRARSSYFDGAD